MNKAIQWSLIAFAGMALFAGVWFLRGGPESPSPEVAERPSPSVSRDRPRESGGSVWEKISSWSGGGADDAGPSGRGDGSGGGTLNPPAPLEASNADRFSDVPIPTDVPQADEENAFEIPESFLVNVYKALLKHARSDPNVSLNALRRLASRSWAYQSMWQISHGKRLMDLPAPPGTEGWKDLTFLFLYNGDFDLARETLPKAAPALSHALKNYLEIIILRELGQAADPPVRKLSDDLEEFPSHAHLLVTNPHNRPNLLFVHTAARTIELRPWDDWTSAIAAKIRDAETLFDQRRFGRKDFRIEDAGAVELLTERAAPGQDIYFLIDESRRPASEKAKFVQGRAEHPIDAWGAEYEITHDTGLTYWLRSATLPPTLLPGLAELRIGQIRKPFFVAADPAPPGVIWMASRRVVAGEWVRIDVRGLPPVTRAGRGFDEGPDRLKLDVIVSQEKKNWLAKTRTDPQGARGSLSMEIRVPGDVLPGMADLWVRIAGRSSEPYPFEVVDYPVPVNEQTRLRPPELSGIAPEERLRFRFANLADAYVALCLMPTGEFSVWTPESPPDTHRIPPAGVWRVPADWPPGPVWMVWAERRGEHWLLPALAGERVTVGPVAGPPEIHNASFHGGGDAVFTAFDEEQNRYVTSSFKKGDLVIRGVDIAPKEKYAVKVIFERGGEVPLTVEPTSMEMLTVNLAGSRQNPVEVNVAKVVRNQPGQFAALPVHDASAADVLDAKTRQGKSAAEWLQQVARLTQRDGRTSAPAPEDLLRRLNLSTLPASPWGGAWKYVPSPDASSYTWLAFDGANALRAQFHTDGAATEWIEYELLSGGEPIGELRDNALGTANGLGNLVADAIREATSAQMSLVSSADLSGNLPAGPVTSAMIERAVADPQGRPRTLQLNGREIKELLIKLLDGAAAVYGSGFTAEMDNPPDPQQLRILMQGTGLIRDEQVYSVTLPERSSEAVVSIPTSAAARDVVTHGHLRTVLEEYLRRHSPLLPDERARLSVRK